MTATPNRQESAAAQAKEFSHCIRHWIPVTLQDVAKNLDELAAENEALKKERDYAALRLDRDGGRLADEVDVLIRAKVLDSRSPAADALLDFREPPSTPRSCRLAALEQELTTSRAAMDKTRQEADRLLGWVGLARPVIEAVRRLQNPTSARAHRDAVEELETLPLPPKET